MVGPHQKSCPVLIVPSPPLIAPALALITHLPINRLN